MTESVCNNICLSYEKNLILGRMFVIKASYREYILFFKTFMIFFCKTIRDIYIVKHPLHI